MYVYLLFLDGCQYKMKYFQVFYFVVETDSI